MYLSKIRVKDYKSFRDWGEIEFKPGINLIVGQNNAGKTTLLEALEIKIHDIPHRSIKTLKNKIHANNDTDNSTLYISLLVPKENLLELSQIYDYSRFRIPFPNKIIDNIKPKIPLGLSQSETEERKKLFALQEKQEREIRIDFINKFLNSWQSGMTFHFKYSNLNSHYNSFHLGLAGEDFNSQISSIIIVWSKEESKFKYYSAYNGRQSESSIDFGWQDIIEFKEKIYRFDAERPRLGASVVGFSKELKADASNLPEVLQNIKNDNPDIYEEFNKYVSEVIPSVKWVSSNKVESQDRASNWNEVRVWSVDKKTRRTDLAFPLYACGTGIGQVLAILYVAIASEEPRTIIIDEPNSFLHPGAAKKLIQILNKFPQHQYFISTHSPEVLSAAKPSTITRLKYVDGETIAESINLEQTKDLRETLSEIGVRFSDVFFAENILWVEGPTEAAAFPLILEKEKELFDVTFLPLVNTGDLREKKQARKNAKLAFEIYRRLSGEHALTPPFVAVVFDKEEENEQEVRELEKISEGKAKFIPRRMFENYLLDSEAIAAVYNDEPELADDKRISAEDIKDWITTKRESKKYLPENVKSQKTIENENWLENVDGARLLEDLYKHFSDKTVEYRKTTHSIKLTEWLLDNKPEQLKELKDFLIKLIENQN